MEKENSPYPSRFRELFIAEFSEEIFGKMALAGDSVNVSVRFNTAKMDRFGIRETDIFPETVGNVPWCGNAVYLPSRPQFTFDPYFQAALYYVQDASSMFAGALADFLAAQCGPSPRILDLCAAPGGKSTLLSSVFPDRNTLIVANEVVRQRSAVLADNIARWGDSRMAVTNADPSDFAAMPEYFDLILADVPCSGEGMFSKDSGAVADWSEDNVKLCAARQRRIVADVWPSLKEGGLLIYSTCTYNGSENDGNVKWICENLGAETVTPPDDSALVGNGVLRSAAGGYHFIPGLVKGLGQYFALLRKCGTDSGKPSAKKKPAGVKQMRPGMRLDVLEGDYTYYEDRDLYKAVPSPLFGDVARLAASVRTIQSGIALYTVKGKDFIPYPDLALCSDLSADGFVCETLDRERAIAYMRRENIILDTKERGYVLLRYGTVPLGFVKNIGNRVNSLWPAARRILSMER